MVGGRSASDPGWQTMSLRYTNPSGAHSSGWIGEDPTTAANLMPMVVQALQGKRKQVMVSLFLHQRTQRIDSKEVVIKV